MKIKRGDWPLLILAGILPWIVCFTIEGISLQALPWFPNQEFWMDIFLKGKSIVITLLGGYMALNLLYRWIRRRLKKPGIEWLALLVLGIMELASAIMSVWSQYSFGGILEQYEPVGVLLAYLVIAFYAYEYVRCGGDLKPVCKVLAVSVGALCILGLTQLLQHDFWETALGKALLIPETYAQLREELHFQFTETGTQKTYMTLYNPDYAGIFLLMVSPILWACKKSKASVLVAVMAGICLLGTGSGTAWLTAGILLLLGFLMTGKGIGENRWKILSAGAAVLLIGGAVWWNVAGAGNSMTQQIPLENVQAGTDAVYLTYAQQSIRLGYTIDEETGGVVQDIQYADGTKVPVVWADDRGECDPKEEKLAGLHFKVYQKNKINYVQFRCEDVVFRFADSPDTGKFEYITMYGKVDALTDADTTGLLPERFLNGRGYIWNHVIPIIGKHPLLGSGPDTFLLAFPQNDYLAKARLGGEFFQTMTTNAHSLYLQMAVQTGIPSVLCMLLFVGIYWIRSWRLYAGKRLTDREEQMGKALFLAVTGYLIAGLTWASSVCTTPFFWMFLGMGIALNERIAGKG